jgi:hypothetical protein
MNNGSKMERSRLRAATGMRYALLNPILEELALMTKIAYRNVLKLVAIPSSGYNVKTYYTYTYQASGGQPAPAANALPQQSGVDHLSIFPIDPTPDLTNHNCMYTISSNLKMSPLPIHFRVTVYGPGNSQVIPDDTRVDFQLTDRNHNTDGACIEPRVGFGYTRNSEVTMTFYPPTDAYWQSHDPAETSLNTMTLWASCRGKETYYVPIEIKPNPEPLIGSTTI